MIMNINTEDMFMKTLQNAASYLSVKVRTANTVKDDSQHYKPHAIK